MGKQEGAPIRFSRVVEEALAKGQPVVGLETAVVTHGLPEPENMVAAQAMTAEIEGEGAVPATCLTLAGELWVGADAGQVEMVARAPDRQKIGAADLGIALAAGVPGGLTVSGTLLALRAAGIRVLATGGIGGVHLDASDTYDVSADLHQLSRSPVVVVCSGIKSVLDIPRTLEYLETLGVPTAAYRTDHFPAFFLRDSGRIVAKLDTPVHIASAARSLWQLKSESGLVVGNPLPEDAAVGPEEWWEWLDAAQEMARQAGIRGKDVTPFLLDQVAGRSEGRTVRANLALLRANAALAAQVALVL